MLPSRLREFEAQTAAFQESAKPLDNPDRGFYTIRGYVIDYAQQDFSNLAQSSGAEEQVLELVEINLRNFRFTDISETGLANIDGLFAALSQRMGKHYIVRFLYDWDGEAKKWEPQNLEIITYHIRQLAPILQRYGDIIFTLQGLLIGNWGEMNGTPFIDTESLRLLAGELDRAAGEKTFLSVRMPMYWRRITGLPELTAEARKQSGTASRLGLYNDGMMGSVSDYGTYSSGEEIRTGLETYWNREQELAFQNRLCEAVPNGGEVIVDNPYNDFAQAAATMKTMHITYLNSEYDRNVLQKWAAATVQEPGCFRGFDGLTYVDRHLGYRYWIEDSKISYSLICNRILLNIAMKNAGFAPVYRDYQPMVTFVGSRETVTQVLPQDIRQLTDDSKALTLSAALPVSRLHENAYDLYLDIRDAENDTRMLLANTAEPEEHGYYIGSIAFHHWFEEETTERK